MDTTKTTWEPQKYDIENVKEGRNLTSRSHALQYSENEYSVSTRRKYASLAGYFLCNIGLTFYNKAILGKFGSPWLLTALHSGFAAFGCLVLLWTGHCRMSTLTLRENASLAAFSLLFTINIAISNVSLNMVSVPFHQVVRSSTPFFTTLIYRLCFARTFSTLTYLSLLPITFGIVLSTFGDYSASRSGVILTFLGVLLAAIKTIATNKLMTGHLRLNAIEFLLRMSPMACIQSIIIAGFRGELEGLFKVLESTSRTSTKFPNLGINTSVLHAAMILAGNGALAFALNVSSFTTNKQCGALTMTVCANLKQCLTILLGMVALDTVVNTMSILGCMMTLIGGALYSYIEIHAK